jgi:small nuclear ribonucleoprotein (snRNP)-like protein
VDAPRDEPATDPVKDPGDDPVGDRLLDDALHELNRWVADAQVADAVELRRRSAWLRRQADEESTLGATLVDLAEQRRPVTVHLANGRRHRGVIVTVGRDALEMQSSVGDRVIVALGAIDSVRPQADAPTAPGDGPVPTGVTLVELVSRLAERRERVLIVTRSGEATSGEITATGRDVVTVALDGGGVVYVSLVALAEVSGAESG